MNRLFISAFLLLLMPLTIAAQMKVVEESAKRTPEWVNAAVEDYLVVSVSGKTMEEVRQKALNEVTEQIIRAVANNVSVTQMNTMSEVNVNGEIESKDVYTYLSKSQSANLPFLKGISMSKAEEIYWEKLRDKKTKEERIDYWVKYPFPSYELEDLIAEFEKLDAGKVRQYEALKAELPQVSSVEQIGRNIDALESLADYFFDDVRRGEAESLKQSYEALYGALTVAGELLSDGEYRCYILLEGRPVSISAKPKVTANCASALDVTPDDGAFIVTYDSSDCLDDEENYVDIVFRVAGKRLSKRHYFSTTGESSFSVMPEGRLYLAADSVDGRTIHNVTLRMTVNNIGGTPFGLKSVELTLPDIPTPLVFDDIDKVYEAKGAIQIKMVAEGSFDVPEVRSSSFTFAQGAMVLVNPETGAMERVRIYLPYETNWDKR